MTTFHEYADELDGCIILLLLPALYVMSFGPACWLDERGGVPYVQDIYRPILLLASGGQLPKPFELYACAGARKGCRIRVVDRGIEWSGPHYCRSGLRQIGLALPMAVRVAPD